MSDTGPPFIFAEPDDCPEEKVACALCGLEKHTTVCVTARDYSMYGSVNGKAERVSNTALFSWLCQECAVAFARQILDASDRCVR